MTPERIVHDDLVDSAGRCRICEKPTVTDAVMKEFDHIDWSETDQDEDTFHDEVCWRLVSGECVDEGENYIEDNLLHVIQRAERLKTERDAARDTAARLMEECEKLKTENERLKSKLS